MSCSLRPTAGRPGCSSGETSRHAAPRAPARLLFGRSSFTLLLAVVIGCVLACVSPVIAIVYPLKTAPTGCTWFQSRFCTNVGWPVPTTTVASADYDRRTQDDIVAFVEYTGSRTCRRWYTDFRCRSAFTYCDATGGFAPCLSECNALASRCPALRVDCTTYSNKSCKTRKELGLPDSITPNDRAFNTNAAAPTSSIGACVLACAFAVLATVLLATW